MFSDSLVYLKRFDIGVKFVESSDPATYASVIDKNTKGIFVESIGNPKYNVAPLPELAKVPQQPHNHGAALTSALSGRTRPCDSLDSR